MTENPFYKDEKLGVFIDGANLYAATRALEFDIDYKLLLKWLKGKTRLVRAFYYTALLDDQEYSPIRPLVDWLDYNGYTMVTKPVKEFTDSHGRKKIKTNIDVELALDMIELSEHLDHVVLFSGDGDFHRLVKFIQRKGLRVTVISTIQTSPSMVSDDLRRQADQFIDLVDLMALVESETGIRSEGMMDDDDDDDDYEDVDADDADLVYSESPDITQATV